jgi:hypothetical protein
MASSIGNFDRFYRLQALALAVVALALPLWNAVVNPYQVFHHAWLPERTFTAPSTNERYLKVAHLLSSGPRHDSLVIGSSIMGMIDPALLKPYFSGHDFYNFSFLAAQPAEILASLKALHKGGLPIRRIVYGIEPIAFTDTASYGPAHVMHPLASGNSGLTVFKDFLFAPSLGDGFTQLVSSLSATPAVRYDIKGSGRYFLDRYDAEYMADPSAYIAAHFPAKAKPKAAPPWVNQRFLEFAALTAWLKHEHVELSPYLNPLHPQVIAAYGDGRLAWFKARIMALAGLLALPDCTRLFNPATASLDFYDLRHFKPEQSPVVLQCALKKI